MKYQALVSQKNNLKIKKKKKKVLSTARVIGTLGLSSSRDIVSYDQEVVRW